uniref:ADP-ribosyl cyclase/cyclic ADP-ribose hydrolase n=1 Tax=Hippocampus comes TaxID=109280 RepID=A0A3Q2ZDD9_HIPCM
MNGTIRFRIVKFSMSAGVLVLCMCAAPLRARSGTTPNIKHIVMGRCFNYITLVNPDIRSDCEEIWRAFEEAVLRQASCDVAAEHYRHMFRAMPQTGACDRFLLWSKTRTLVQDYAAVAHHLWTLEDTLVGYMFNDLIWCGQQEHSDFNFGSCPEWSACVHHPVHSLWRQASKNVSFASASIHNFQSTNFFLLFQKLFLGLSMHRESCDGASNTLARLQSSQPNSGKFVRSILTMLQCVHKPEHSACHTCTDCHPMNWQIMDKFWRAKTNFRSAK